MKWPESITLIRHGESAFNASKTIKAENNLYQKFRASYQENPESQETKALAQEVSSKLSLDYGDHNTPLSDEGHRQAETTGKQLQNLIRLPEIVYVSPYERTHDTLNGLIKGWPALKQVKTYEEERIREKEHGLLIAYNDSYVFRALHPEQRRLIEKEGPYFYRFPQGENIPDVRERIRSWTNTIIREFPGMNLLVVTHHLTILSLRANFERLDAKQFQEIDETDKPVNCGVTIYKATEGGRAGRLTLDTYNKKLY